MVGSGAPTVFLHLLNKNRELRLIKPRSFPPPQDKSISRIHAVITVQPLGPNDLSIVEKVRPISLKRKSLVVLVVSAFTRYLSRSVRYFFS